MTAFDDARASITLAEQAYQGLLQVLVEAERVRDLFMAERDQIRAEYEAHMATHEPEPEPAPLKVIGMSAPADEWSTRLSEVGANGIRARRIFCDLAKGATHQLAATEEAIDAGMTPVLSYKVGGDIAGALNSRFDTVAQQVSDRLRGYNVPIAVTFWHEPNPDITGAQFVALHRRYLPIFQSEEIKVGPIWNGWLLDNQVSTFSAYSSPDLLAAWDFAGMDIYAKGDKGQPSTWGEGPARGLPKLVNWLTAQGVPHKPILIGEYNGWTAEHITEMGEAMLSTPTLWAGLTFNSDNGAKGLILTGDRLAAFKATKADPRVQQ